MQKNTLSETISSLNIASPMMLFIAMLLSFILMMAMQIFFYTELFTEPFGSHTWAMAAAIGIALFFQITRLASGISVGSAFSRGKSMEGMGGLLLSIALAIFESYEVHEVSLIWGKQGYSPTAYMLVLNGILWFGLGLELRFAWSISGMAKEDKTEEEEDDDEEDFLPLPKVKTRRVSKNGQLS